MKARKRATRSLAQRFRRRRRVLVGVSSPMNLVCLRPVLDVLRADDRVDLFAAGHVGGGDDVRPLLATAGLDDVTPLSEKEAKRLAGDLYLCVDGTRFGKRCHSRVLGFHGVSFKGRSLGDRPGWFHRVMLVGPYQRRRFVERGTFAATDPALVDVGFPKLDPLVRGEIDRDAVRDALGVPAGNVCVLLAPTWGEHAALETWGEPLVDTLAAIDGTSLVVKLHDHAFDPTRGGADLRDAIARWRAAGVAVSEDRDVVPLLAAADLLVTDASSVAQEFCLLDRPIVYADVPELFASERYRDTVDLETWGRRAGTVAADPAELAAAVRAAIADPAARGETRRAVAADLFFHPGRATDRALDVVYAELALARPPSDQNRSTT